MTELLSNFAAGRWSPGTGAGTPLFDSVLGHELVRALNFYHRRAALQASTTVLAALDK